jgi:hypothetical protein
LAASSCIPGRMWRPALSLPCCATNARAGLADRRRETGLATGGRPRVTVSVIVFPPVAPR